MASNYPGALDDFPNKAANDVIPSAGWNDLVSAVEKIETELGVNPSGAADDVAVRFTALGDLVAAVNENQKKVNKISLSGETDGTYEAAKWLVSHFGKRFANGSSSARTLVVPKHSNTVWGSTDITATGYYFLVQRSQPGTFTITAESPAQFFTELQPAGVSSLVIPDQNGIAQFIEDGTDRWAVGGNVALP